LCQAESLAIVPGTIPIASIVADSAEATGLKWAAPAGGSGLVYVGGATFTTSSAININDVFSSTYQNYKIVAEYITNVNTATLFSSRLRVSGSDNTTSNYQVQTLYGSGATASASRSSSQTSWRWLDASDEPCMFEAIIVKPFETKITQMYGYGIARGGDASNAEIGNLGATFNATTSFTGISFFTSGDTLTGNIRVYGLANS
jgi:hypothetical protein